MALKDVFKVTRKTFFNPTGWLGYDMLSAQFKLSSDIIKNAFAPRVARHTETFDEAMARLQLTESDIQKIGSRYFLIALIFFVCGILTFLFSFYLLFHYVAIAGWILGLATTGLFIAYSFRNHFLYFQIKHRKLGCTFAEWRRGKPDSDKSTPP